LKPPPFEYHAPTTLPEALTLIATLPNAKILAGGQSLMPMLNMRYVLPDHVVDLNRVRDLEYIREATGAIEIGALARQVDIASSALVRVRIPILIEALRHVGHVQTRNRGTIGGSLCNLDPSAELPAMAMLLDAEISIASSRGERRVAMRDFPAYYMTPAIEPDEVVTALRFPVPPAGHGYGFEEFARRRGDFAVVAVGAILMGASGRIDRAAVVIAGVGPAPLRIHQAEQLLSGQPASADVVQGAAAKCLEIEAMGDAYASSDYRRHLARVLSGRALVAAARRLSSST
jgi:carbon-monoxide dehydrogenase medium subunit